MLNFEIGKCARETSSPDILTLKDYVVILDLVLLLYIERLLFQFGSLGGLIHDCLDMISLALFESCNFLVQENSLKDSQLKSGCANTRACMYLP